MNKIFLTLAAAVLAASAAHAQSEALSLSARAFDAQAAEAMQPFVLEDSFAGVGACGILDAKAFRAWTFDEASNLAAPCLKVVGARYSSAMALEAGLVSSANAQPRAGLLLKTDLIPGSKAHRELLASLERRGGELLGYQVRLLVRGEVVPASVSPVQDALKQCILTTVVRDIRTSADFLKVYGSCLSRNPDLKIDALSAGSGLVVDVRTEQAPEDAQALDGFVVVNAGMGPVRVMIVADGVRASK